MQIFLPMLFILSAMLTSACGGYEAAESKDLQARQGELVGVLIDAKGKSHPDASVQLFAEDGTTILLSNNMDSDGAFSLFPPAAGTYSVIGVLGETEKVIKQKIVFNGDGQNIGTLQGQTVAALSVHVTTPDGIEPSGVKVEVLGTEGSATTIEEGAGILEYGIPAGTYSIRFSKDGLEELIMTGVTFTSEEAKLLDPVAMSAAAP